MVIRYKQIRNQTSEQIVHVCRYALLQNLLTVNTRWFSPKLIQLPDQYYRIFQVRHRPGAAKFLFVFVLVCPKLNRHHLLSVFFFIKYTKEIDFSQSDSLKW